MPKFNLTDSAVRDYLSGETFGEQVAFEYEFRTPLTHRTKILADLATNKDVLHIGCCDHIPLLDEKIRLGTWLHGNLSKISSSCVGIDIDRTSVNKAREISGLGNIFHGDITSHDHISEIADRTFDYAIFGEVLEHIGNPVHFIKSFLSNYGRNVQNVVITVPNAFRGGNVLNIFKGLEAINTDHRFFFTPYTLAKVAWDAGLAPVSMQMAHYSAASPIKAAILNSFPLLAEDLVFVGRPRASLN